MADIIAKKFEVARTVGGAAATSAWIKSQIGVNATKLLTVLEYNRNDTAQYIVLLSTIATRAAGSVAFGTNVATATFSINQKAFDATAGLVAWMNAQVAGVAAPAAPVLSQITAGNLTGQGTVSVRITYVTPVGETLASVATAVAVADNKELVVASPVADVTNVATGYNVYLGAAGSEKKQNLTPIALGTAYTQATAPTTTGTLASAVTNTTVLTMLQHITTYSRGADTLATVIMSN